MRVGSGDTTVGNGRDRCGGLLAPPVHVIVVLVFAIVLLLAVLLSGLAKRSVLSTAVLFLIAGFVTGSGVFGWITVAHDDEVVGRFAELALFSVLFVDGLHLGASRQLRKWRLPGRALVLGLPFTLIAIAVLAHYVAGESWTNAWLLGAALSPTDPVFAAALIGNNAVPERLRHLLNVESGLNDGLAVPLVVLALGLNGAHGRSLSGATLEAALGVALGVALAWVAVRVLRSFALFEIAEGYESIGALSVGLLVFAVSSMVHANEFLAAFAAGVTLALVAPRAPGVFDPLGGPLAELLKLAAVLLFGAFISPALLTALRPRDYVFAVLSLLLARPLSMLLALAGARLTKREKLVAGWFGPKGFASVFFGFLILQSGIEDRTRLFSLLALVIVMSIVAHSSTDVLVARRFESAQA